MIWWLCIIGDNPESKAHGANMGSTWVLSAPDGPHIGPMNLAIREYLHVPKGMAAHIITAQVVITRNKAHGLPSREFSKMRNKGSPTALNEELTI